MEAKATFIVRWKPVKGGTESSYLTESEGEAIEALKNNVRLSHMTSIEVMR